MNDRKGFVDGVPVMGTVSAAVYTERPVSGVDTLFLTLYVDTPHGVLTRDYFMDPESRPKSLEYLSELAGEPMTLSREYPMLLGIKCMCTPMSVKGTKSIFWKAKYINPIRGAVSASRLDALFADPRQSVIPGTLKDDGKDAPEGMAPLNPQTDDDVPEFMRPAGDDIPF